VADALNALPVTLTVTWSEFEHVVNVEVAVRVNVVVEDRFTVLVLRLVGFVTEAAGVQPYVNGPVPVTEPVSVVLVPFGMDLSVPAFTAGRELTVAITEVLDAVVHPLLVAST
jgi:hypothetical protein